MTLRKSFNRSVHLRVTGTPWQTSARSAVPCNSVQLDRITPNSRGAPINFKTKKKVDILKQRSPFRRALAARAPRQPYRECENKLPPHEPDSKILSTGQKQDKTKPASNTEHGGVGLTKQANQRRDMFRGKPRNRRINLTCVNELIVLSSRPLTLKPAHSSSHEGSLLSRPNLCNWRECGSLQTVRDHWDLQSMQNPLIGSGLRHAD